MYFKTEAACGSFIGCNREINEDNFYFNKKHLPSDNRGLKAPIRSEGNTREPAFFAVFDGMGGGVDGEVASCTASEIFTQEFKKLDELALSGKEFFINACNIANDKIVEQMKERQASVMGATAAAIYVSDDEVVACNLGDSKIFRIRDNCMQQISEDHTDEKLIKAMGISKKPVLLQYLGIDNKEMAIEPYFTKGDICKNDIFVLCTDGVTDAVSVERIFDTVNSMTAADAVKFILADVEKNNGDDNSTVIVIKMTE